MIRRLVLRRFKRFADVTIHFPGHLVLAGPNNSGKTTVLQAISTWAQALYRWRLRNDFQKHNGYYAKVPVTRQEFYSVPMRRFDLLWTDLAYRGTVEIEVQGIDGWVVTMEIIADSTEQVYVRPKPEADSAVLRTLDLSAVYIPAMSGLSVDEPVLRRPKIDQLLGQCKPGEVLRNLLVDANESGEWEPLAESIRRLFGYELLPPDATGADIVAEYRNRPDGPALDINTAGSGFLQVLMLLTFLHTRKGSILLLDEPDAHLHVILQDAIYSELQSVAMRQHSQLIVATHSEVIINSVDPRELCMLIATPKLVADAAERRRLAESLRVLTNLDVTMVTSAPGVLFTEDYTDKNILREWARVLKHPSYEPLTRTILWKASVTEQRPGATGIRAKDYFDKLTLIRPDLSAIEIVDGDGQPGMLATEITGMGFQRQRWMRYEIESYLFHPTALERFVREQAGGNSAEHVEALRKHLEDNYPRAFIESPLSNAQFLIGTKARVHLIPPALEAAGIYMPYTRYHEIAALMKPDEIHPEVVAMLDAIQKALRL